MNNYVKMFVTRRTTERIEAWRGKGSLLHELKKDMQVLFHKSSKDLLTKNIKK